MHSCSRCNFIAMQPHVLENGDLWISGRPTGINLMGPQGIQGVTGDDGADGKDGAGTLSYLSATSGTQSVSSNNNVLFPTIQSQSDDDNIISNADGTFTLQPGTYDIQWFLQTQSSPGSVLMFYLYTNTGYTISSSAASANSTTANGTIFNFTAPNTIFLRYDSTGNITLAGASIKIIKLA